ncbi:MAG TPA: histidine ammonia-lyase [Gemmatimonadales bacterium]|jgi:histidine ammonia-lyase|nr:histidine ammonia-lyase [Gemmatimonadales bacterium]
MPPPTLVLDGRSLTVPEVVRVARDSRARVAIAPAALSELARSRAVLEHAIERGEVLYGVNTGFGKLANIRIEPDQLERLQTNLIRSHAAGVGAPFPAEIVRSMLLLRANVLLRPTSGVRPLLPEAVVGLLNAGVIPWVPEQGSVGASGDLAPLAHLALALSGEGDVAGPAGPSPAGAALQAAGLTPFRFAPKEGLAFINGTQAQTAVLALLVHDADVLWRSALGAAAMSLEALRGTPTPLDARIHEQRPHEGQLEAASILRRLLEASEIRESHRENDPRVQDAYSLRCTPQVLGAVGDAIGFARRVVAVELNASTDNPLVFGEGEVLSGGNFHGQPVAQALDFLAIALTTLQALAERRIERLVNPDLSQGLPAFLTAQAGLASGYMMVQITAASLVAESRALAHPASTGSIPTDANQEDFVPMGMAAAYKTRRVLANAQRVVAAEFLCAAEGLESLKPLRPGGGVERLYQRIRRMPDGVAALREDRPPAPDLERLASLVAGGELAP